MKECPSPFELEAYFVGEFTAEIDAHINGCKACSAYVQALGEERSEMLSKRSVTDFLNEPVLSNEFDEGVRRPWWQRIFAMPILVPSLVTAAALIVWVQSPSKLDRSHLNPGSPTPGGLSLTADDTLRLKGRSITVIVERKRGSKVDAFSTAVPVQKDDAIGITLQLAQPATLAVALQDVNSGQWVRLVHSKAFTAGTTRVTQEASQAVTDNQTRGRLVVGAPADVDAMMAGKEPSEPLIELSIVPEVTP